MPEAPTQGESASAPWRDVALEPDVAESPAPRTRPGGRWIAPLVVLIAVAVVAGVIVLMRPRGGVASDTFSLTGPMTVVREWPSVTLLPDGRVLVAGGLDTELNPIASAELYDPATGTFGRTGSMAVPRAGQAALLADGRVLVLGGRDSSDQLGKSIADAELYDPRTGTFSPTGSMTVARDWPSVTLLADGRVLVAGGYTASQTGSISIASAELYDPATGTFSPTGSMAAARAGDATLLADGRVLVAGGRDVGGTSIADAELYDPRTGTFSPTGSMTVARDWPSVTLLADGRVLVAGGYTASQTGAIASAELYDPRTGTFSPTGSLATARAGRAALLADGRVLVAGGYDAGGKTAAAELYDPATGTFSPTGSMTIARDRPVLTRLQDGRVLVVGSMTKATAELFR